MSAPGDRFAVHLGRIAEFLDRIERFDQHLDRDLREVDKRIHELHGTWTGEAARAHRAAHDEWVRGAAEMRVALVALRAIVGTAHANYSAAVMANVDMWSRLR